MDKITLPSTATRLIKPRPPPPPPPIVAPKTPTATTPNAGLLFREKLLYLSSLNVNPHKALNLNPAIRSAPLSTLLSVEKCLLSMGLPRRSIGRILDMHPSLLTAHPDLHLYPVLDFLLNEVPLPFPHISPSIVRCPRLLVSPISSQLRPALAFLRSLGFALDSHSSLLLVYDVERSLLRKIRFLQGLGFSEEEVRTMVVRSPATLTYSVEGNLGPKADYFLAQMKGDLEELNRFPQYFSFSLEQKIKPRHQMLAQYGLRLPLSKMLKVSDAEFTDTLLDLRLEKLEKMERRHT
ncbi:hypothetical protein Tsubulata_034333 [Turnera subulata]|uniref:Uncharacterized protein n=1 Tax=Turnera subulata TaxID=218843 RepID=A0A9Q0G5M1_9ROSI|nr:hypothetical protein Tsubulata_034333 [Turnera subulata]